MHTALQPPYSALLILCFVIDQRGYLPLRHLVLLCGVHDAFLAFMTLMTVLITRIFTAIGRLYPFFLFYLGYCLP